MARYAKGNQRVRSSGAATKGVSQQTLEGARKLREQTTSLTSEVLLASLGGLATSRDVVSIRVGNVSMRDLISGTSPAPSAELTALEETLKKAKMQGGLMSIPTLAEPSLDGSGPRLRRAQDNSLEVAYQTCRLEAKSASGSYEWFPEIIKVNWQAEIRRSGTRGSGTVDHFADLEVASCWAKYAKALATDSTKIRALDSVNPSSTKDEATSLKEFLAQNWFVHDCFNAICQFYNALNIPWHTDPEARRLYRYWLAGESAGGDAVVFSARTDYNDGGWYHKGHWTDEKHPIRLRPRLMPDFPKNRLGAIPRAAREMWDRFGPFGDNNRFPIDFRIRAGIVTSDVKYPNFDDRSAAEGERQIDYSDAVINRAFVIPMALDKSRLQGNQNALSIRIVDPVAFGSQRSEVLQKIAFQILGGQLGDYFGNTINFPEMLRNLLSDWRSFSWDDRITLDKVPFQVSAPLRMYLDWAIDWANSINARTPDRVLSQARTSVVATNWKWKDFLGEAGFVEKAATAATTASNEGKGSDVVDAVIQIGGTFTELIPGVGRLIGGAVTSAMPLITKLIRFSPPKSTSRDDLGRWKPVVERGYLSGDPLSDVPAEGKPLHEVQTLPGFCRTRAPVAPSNVRPEESRPPPASCPDGQVMGPDGTCVPAPPPESCAEGQIVGPDGVCVPAVVEREGLSTAAKVAIGIGAVAAIGGGAFLVYRITRSR
jgi:hypothetical protein